jgi:hypothetical protein
MAGLSISGVVGHVKWAYYTAAAVNGYKVTRSADNRWSLRGTIVLADAFKLSQRPLMFVAPTEKGEWRWPIVDLQIISGELTAQLGPPQEQ